MMTHSFQPSHRPPAGGRHSGRFLPLLLAALLPLVLLLSLPGGALLAQSDDAVEQRVRDISDQLRCPTCQAVSVRDSEASFSRQIKDKVRRMVVEGQSDEDIKAYFVSRYGEWILRAPKKEGFGLVLWLLPGFGMAVGGVLLLLRVRRNGRLVAASRRSAPEAGAPGAEPELSEHQRERIARDMARFESQD